MNNVKNIILLFLVVFSSSIFANETYFLLIRHGETAWNAEKRVQGHSDIPLNTHGIEQANQLAEKLVQFHPDIASNIYSSDLQRAFVTAQITLNRFRKDRNLIGRITPYASLREISWGEADGMLSIDKKARYEKVEQKALAEYPKRKERWDHTHVPGAETFNQLTGRVKNTLSEITQRHTGEKVAVFAHSRLINTLVIDIQDLEVDSLPTLPNCAVVHVRYVHGSKNPFQFVKIESLLDESVRE